MNTPLFLESFAALLPRGICTRHGMKPWDSGQAGPADVLRGQVLDKPYVSFGKLSLPDRLAFSAASLALAEYPVDRKETAGICLGLPAGSVSTDLRYMESVVAGFPSPAVFSATLPSSAIADIAIFFGFKGENRVFAGGADSGLCALESALTLLAAGKAGTVLVLSVNAVETGDFSSLLLPPGDYCREHRAYAFLLSANPRPGGLGYGIAARFECCNKDQPQDSGELYFYQLAELILAGKSGTVDGTAAGTTCRITLTKDQR
jgi:hypothetical protein